MMLTDIEPKIQQRLGLSIKQMATSKFKPITIKEPLNESILNDCSIPYLSIIGAIR
jgi:hypothetical protein